MDLPLKRIEEFLHKRIPLARAMNCQILSCTGDSLSIQVPKFANTVEGEQLYEGTANFIAILTVWTLLQVGLRRLDYLPESSLIKADWRSVNGPEIMDTELISTCSLPSSKEWQQFLRMLSRKARAKITMRCEVVSKIRSLGVLTCEFETLDLDHQ